MTDWLNRPFLYVSWVWVLIAVVVGLVILAAIAVAVVRSFQRANLELKRAVDEIDLGRQIDGKEGLDR